MSFFLKHLLLDFFEEHKIAEDEAISGDEDEEPSNALRLTKGKMKIVS